MDQQTKVGKVFGRLTVLDEGMKVRGRVKVNCRCSCGVEKQIAWYFIRTGATKSCGCLQREKAAAQGRAKKTHGKSKTAEFKIWGGIKKRCYNKKATRYSLYGGRGITMADEWKDSFEAFLDHVGLRPSPKYSLDRIDNDKGYQPGNVRWVTHKEQSNNRRTNRVFEYNGSKLTLKQLAQLKGINYGTVLTRLNAYGMTLEEALFQGSYNDKSKA